MKTTLFAALAILALSAGARAAEFHLPAAAGLALPSDGCGGGISHVSDLVGHAEPCCDHALGCAQFLATTRVKRRQVEPHT